MRVEIQMRSGKIFKVKNRHVSRVIDLEKLFFDHWSSNAHEFTVPRQSCSPHSPPVSDSEAQRTLFSMEINTNITGLLSYNSPQALLFVVCDCPSQPDNNLGIVGISALVAPPTRRTVKGILPDDE